MADNPIEFMERVLRDTLKPLGALQDELHQAQCQNRWHVATIDALRAELQSVRARGLDIAYERDALRKQVVELRVVVQRTAAALVGEETT